MSEIPKISHFFPSARDGAYREIVEPASQDILVDESDLDQHFSETQSSSEAGYEISEDQEQTFETPTGEDSRNDRNEDIEGEAGESTEGRIGDNGNGTDNRRRESQEPPPEVLTYVDIQRVDEHQAVARPMRNTRNRQVINYAQLNRGLQG